MGAADRLAAHLAAAGEPVDLLIEHAPFELSEAAEAALRADAADWRWSRAVGALGAAGGGLMRLLSAAGLVAVFLLFLMLERGDRTVPVDSLRGQVERRIQGYIAVTFLVSAATGVLTGAILWALGVRLAWAFGALAFVLNFIPNVGSVVATLLPVPMVLFVQDLPLWVQVLAILLPALVQFALGNVVAPKLLGDRLQLSPVAVLLGLIVLGAIWGLPGLVLSTPAPGDAEDRLRAGAAALAARLPARRGRVQRTANDRDILTPPRQYDRVSRRRRRRGGRVWAR